MKVIQHYPDGSRIILNPVQLPAIIENSRRGGAGGVLTQTDLAVSTVGCSSHTDITEACGIEIDDIFKQRFDAFEIGKKHLRLQMGPEGFDIELWLFDHWSNNENYDYDDLPLTKDSLDELAAWAAGHPRIKAAYGKVEPSVSIMIMDDASPVWTWRDGVLTKDFAESPAP